MPNVKDEVLEVVKTIPGVTRAEVVELIPDHGRMEVGHALTTLVRRGKLAVGEKPSPNKRGPRKVQTFSLATGKPVPKKTAPKHDDVITDLVKLRNEVSELRAWKRDAIRRYPDLAVAPIVLEARKIVAAQFDNGRAASVMAGECDDSPIMKAVIQALGQV